MPPAEDSFRFPVREKIKSTLVIQQVVEGRNSIFAYPLKCFFRYVPATEKNAPDLQLSVNVSKRRFKHAVDRNRVKRLMREAFRLQKNAFPIRENQTLQMYWMFVGKELPAYDTIFQSVATLAAKLTNYMQQ